MAGSPNFIAVFCAAEIPPNARNSLIPITPEYTFLLLLTTFLTEAYGASTSDVTYAFVTFNDPATPFTAARPPVQDAIETPGVKVCADAVEQLQQLPGDADSRYFVVLDEHSLQPERGCVIGDAKGENYVRCRFGTSLLAAEALRSGRKRWPDLWLDAALAGGVIPQPRDAGDRPGRYRSFTDREDVQRCVRTLLQREIQENDPGKDQPFAVFCTVDVPVSLLKDLLTESKSPETKGLCVLDTLEPNQQTRTTTEPVQTFTSPFIGKDFSRILQFVTDVLPASSLHNEKFIVLDSFTLSQRSVLQVDVKGAWRDDVDAEGILRDVFAARDSFETAHTNFLEAVGSMEEFANEAATRGGVYDF